VKKKFQHPVFTQIIDNEGNLFALFFGTEKNKTKIILKIHCGSYFCPKSFFYYPQARVLIRISQPKVDAMNKAIQNHFLSIRENSRFFLFLLLSCLLIGLGMLHKSRAGFFWPAGSELIDNTPKERISPAAVQRAFIFNPEQTQV
jgi:hypothetical protein